MLALESVGPTLPGVARAAIWAWLFGERRVREVPIGPPAPVFVTLRNRDGSLRGCIGTLAPTEPDVVSETARSAVLAASSDPRFPPLAEDEFENVSIEVSVLEPEEPVESFQELDPKTYGVVVRNGSGRRGLLLPDIEGVEDATMQVDIACRKGGIAPGDPIRVSRFRVRKWVG